MSGISNRLAAEITQSFDLQATIVPPDGDEDDGVALIDGRRVRPGDELSALDGERLPVRVVEVGDGRVRVRPEGGDVVEVRLGE